MSSNVEAYHWGVTPIHILRHAKHPMRYGDKRRTSLLGIATGFFFENEKTIYLITNRHVAIKEKDDHYPNAFEIFLHTSQEIIREVRVAHIPLYDENIEPLWIEYPHFESTFIDIIAINLKNYLQDRDVTYRWSKKDGASRSQILSLESNIRVLGYPLGFHDAIHHVPISRHATVASPYGIAFRGEPYYLIDSVLHARARAEVPEFGSYVACADLRSLRARQFPQIDCVAFGTPDYYSYVAGGLKTFMDDHYVHDVRKGLKGLRGKPYALFYSHGGGGRVRDTLGVFKRVGTLVGEPVESYGKPGPGVLERCRALGKELAEAV